MSGFFGLGSLWRAMGHTVPEAHSSISARLHMALREGQVTAEEAERFISRENPFPHKKAPLFMVVRRFRLGRTSGKSSDECFIDERFSYHSRERPRSVFGMQTAIPEDQPSAAPCVVSVLGSLRAATYHGWARALTGAPKSACKDVVGMLLREYGHHLTLPQVEKVMQALADESEDLKRHTYHYFTEAGSHDQCGKVVVGKFNLSDMGWYVTGDRLDYEPSKSVGDCLLVRNLNLVRAGM